MLLYTHKCAHFVPSRQSCTFRGFPSSTEPDPTWHSTNRLSAEQGRRWIPGRVPALQSSMRTLEQPEVVFPVLHFPPCAGRLGSPFLRGELRGSGAGGGSTAEALCSAGFCGRLWGYTGREPCKRSSFILSVVFPELAFELFCPCAVPLVLMESQAGLCTLGASFCCMNSHIYAY